VARYSLRYFNQYETKCISANLLAFLSRISKHYLHGSIIKMCISWFLSWAVVISIVLAFANVHNFEHSRKPQPTHKPCNNLQTFKTIYKISESFVACWFPTFFCSFKITIKTGKVHLWLENGSIIIIMPNRNVTRWLFIISLSVWLSLCEFIWVD